MITIEYMFLVRDYHHYVRASIIEKFLRCLDLVEKHTTVCLGLCPMGPRVLDTVIYVHHKYV